MAVREDFNVVYKTTSNVGLDSISAVDNVKKSSNIYDDDDDVHS